MPDIKLGPPGFEVALPPIKYAPRAGIELPTECSRQVDEATMLDGSIRANVRKIHPLRWPLEWDELLWDEVEDILDIVRDSYLLSVINEFTDSAAYPCFARSWAYAPIAETTGQAATLYRFSLELRGIGT